MICDLSGKEERLCEHRTKIKWLIHCTSICFMDFFFVVVFFVVVFVKDEARQGNETASSCGSFSPRVAPGSLLLCWARSRSGLPPATVWGGSRCRPSPQVTSAGRKTKGPSAVGNSSGSAAFFLTSPQYLRKENPGKSVFRVKFAAAWSKWRVPRPKSFKGRGPAAGQSCLGTA